MKLLFHIILLIFILGSCSKEEYPGVIKGNVLLTDHYDYMPISGYDDHSGIVVSLHDINGFKKSATTDFDGNFEIENVKPGEYKLRFEKEGFSFYEKFEIIIEGADTIDVYQTPAHSKVIRLLKLRPLEYKIVDGPYIDSYKRSCYSALKDEMTMCLRYDIVTEVEKSRDFGCIAYISTEQDVDYMNYQMAIPCRNFGRYGIPNPILEFEFADLDRELFPLSTEIYIRYYPIDDGLMIHDPWLNIDKYCMIHFNKSKIVKFTIPGNADYFEDIPIY